MRVYAVTITENFNEIFAPFDDSASSPVDPFSNLWDLMHRPPRVFADLETAKTYCEVRFNRFAVEHHGWDMLRGGPAPVAWNPPVLPIETEWRGEPGTYDLGLELGQFDWNALIEICEVHLSAGVDAL